MLFENQKIETRRLSIVLQSDKQMEEIITTTDDISLRRLCEAILENCISEPGNRNWFSFWKIYIKGSDIEIGYLRFLGAPSMGSVEIVHDIDKDFYGNGYVTEAINAITNWAFSQDGVYIVYEEIGQYDELAKTGLDAIGFVECGEGLEGIRYRRVKPMERNLMVFSCIGLLAGLIIGSIISRILYGIGIGFGFGLIAGAIMQLIDYHARDKACGDDADIDVEYEKKNKKEK